MCIIYRFSSGRDGVTSASFIVSSNSVDDGIDSVVLGSDTVIFDSRGRESVAGSVKFDNPAFIIDFGSSSRVELQCEKISYKFLVFN